MKSLMKITTLAYLVLSAVIFVSCKPKDELASLKKDLASKKEKLNALQVEIDDLNGKIAALEPEKKIDSIIVAVEDIKPTEFVKYAKLQGTVISDNVYKASSEVGGRILKLLVKEGDYVKRGQLIASIDMDALEKQKEEISTQLSLANTVFERQKNLWDQQIGSELQYLQAKNNKERLEKSIETLNSQLSKRNIYAPFSGYVDQELIKEGEMSAPGAPILVIINNDKLKIKADVPENYLTKVKVGEPVIVSLPALNEEIQSKISLLGRVIDPSNRTFSMEVDLANPRNIYKPNLLAEVEVVEYKKDDAIVIPIDFVMEAVSGDKYVYTVNTTKDGSLAQKSIVTLGEGYQGQIEILSGLKNGDRLITDGSHLVVDGSHVDIQKESKQ
ncbi:MAG TPA: efflux RND transporter periplasmic adaptor subunit [Saprospiraceae bacterium]|nr:efflux RND transporter periplasmic adaptor subunit [Saprospiraceae bacterium]HPQ20213.1 efflux RND transporter periplasmic adaptor subunit [Saprospiraceae bacterium]